MGALSRVLRRAADGKLLYRCPGCGCAHFVAIGDGPRPRWTWNGDAERPTFSPSILVRHQMWSPPVTAENMKEFERAPWPQTLVETVCHSFVEGGRIRFLGDCTHSLADQTVAIPAWDDELPPDSQTED